MTKETFCSFEVAKLLRDHGFAEPVIAWYDENGELHSGSDHVFQAITCPTHQMALRWLREEKKVIIWIDPVIPSPIPGDNTRFNWVWRLKKKLYQYPCVNGKEYATYEEATEGALVYALEKWVQNL